MVNPTLTVHCDLCDAQISTALDHDRRPPYGWPEAADGWVAPRTRTGSQNQLWTAVRLPRAAERIEIAVKGDFCPECWAEVMAACSAAARRIPLWSDKPEGAS